MWYGSDVSRDRREEVWVREFLSRVLCVPVDLYDNGSGPAMFDLLIRYRDRPHAAVEITTATDRESTELERLVNPGGARRQIAGIAGAWKVDLDPNVARKAALDERLPRLLGELEARGIERFDAGVHSDALSREASALGIASAFHSRTTNFPGSVYLNVEQPVDRLGGYVQPTSNAVVEWLETFLTAPQRARKIQKLAKHRDGERHIFVVIPLLGTAPFNAFDPLIRAGAPLPTQTPNLPSALTHAWVVHVFSRQVFSWSRQNGWSTFDALPPESVTLSGSSRDTR
jgi:hypothetical protein